MITPAHGSGATLAPTEDAMLEGVLGNILFTGMGLSHTRRGEALQMYTKAVSLHFAIELNGDFTLEVYLRPSFGQCILDVIKLLSVESLRGLLGGFLFEAMNVSNYRRGEVMLGYSLTSAVLIVDNSSGD
jgi:hypothetical protein